MHYFIPKDSDFYASSEGDHTPSSYLRTILPKWKKLVQTSQLKPGSPLVLIITSSAIRAVHLNRYKHYLWIIQSDWIHDSITWWASHSVLTVYCKHKTFSCVYSILCFWWKSASAKFCTLINVMHTYNMYVNTSIMSTFRNALYKIYANLLKNQFC